MNIIMSIKIKFRKFFRSVFAVNQANLLKKNGFEFKNIIAFCEDEGGYWIKVDEDTVLPLTKNTVLLKKDGLVADFNLYYLGQNLIRKNGYTKDQLNKVKKYIGYKEGGKINDNN